MSAVEFNWNDMNLSPEHQTHLNTLLESMRIYIDRDLVRGDLWRLSGPGREIEMIREKMNRIERCLGMITPPPDDAASHAYSGNDVKMLDAILDDSLDVINFAVFLIRKIREGNFG